MTAAAAPGEHEAILGIGEAVVRDARHAEAIASLAAGPVPQLLAAVHALQAVLLAASPKALRARAGWIGRLLGRDLVLEAEGRALRGRLRVLVHDAEAGLAAFGRFDQSVATHEDRLLAAIGALDAAIGELDAAAAAAPPASAEAIERRRHHLQSLQQAWRITATQLALTRFNHGQLAQRIQPMLALVQVLLEQDRGLRAARADTDALHAVHRALDSAQAALAGYSPPHPAQTEHAP